MKQFEFQIFEVRGDRFLLAVTLSTLHIMKKNCLAIALIYRHLLYII